ncbi:MAG: LPXTG cell wall anchor domain-containing protein, partial [Streptococcus gallolyticus]|nr:LPXTG cell wall anchor domain-containing protein [Streptococcus gallolyticus]
GSSSSKGVSSSKLTANTGSSVLAIASIAGIGLIIGLIAFYIFRRRNIK